MKSEKKFNGKKIMKFNFSRNWIKKTIKKNTTQVNPGQDNKHIILVIKGKPTQINLLNSRFMS